MKTALKNTEVDLLVIGGGVNGSGIARDAAGRGLKVLLCEKADLAGHTSSASTKLIHGGLRYLENYEFKLVRESLIEREILLRAAPHIIWPQRFVLPHHKGLRPAWLLRLGLFIYDHLGGRKLLPATTKVHFANTPQGAVLSKTLRFGYEYSDCAVDDARLVVLNAVSAAEKGAEVLTRTACTNLVREDDVWRATLTSQQAGQQEGQQEDQPASEQVVTARAVVNAAGPWVDEILDNALAGRNVNKLRLVKGSHIVTRKLFEGDDAYLFQHKDGRVIFAIPYMGDYTLIGTTDIPHENSDEPAVISSEETSYLCELISEYLANPLTAEDVLWSYSGVRPLFDDQEANASVVTRDYAFEVNGQPGEAPLLSIYGGKLTTYRKLSEQAVDKLEPVLKSPTPAHWTATASLPGGEIDNANFAGLAADVSREYLGFPQGLVMRLLRAYGTRARQVLGDAQRVEDLGTEFGEGLYEAEVRYLLRNEFALTAQDILWRRSKLGLKLSEAQAQRLQIWLDKQAALVSSTNSQATRAAG